MDNKLSDFCRLQLHPAIFDRADIVFPELELRKHHSGKKWITSLKLDLSRAKDGAPDKTSVYVNDKSGKTRVAENGGEDKEAIDYYRERRGLQTQIEAIRALSDLLGLQMPTGGNLEQYKARKTAQGKLEELCKKMQADLHSPAGANALKYLREKRGYSDELIKKMRLGFATQETQQKLKAILKNGAVHTGEFVAIPYVSTGEYCGVVFRNIMPNPDKKYINAFLTDSDTKKYNLFGLAGQPMRGGKAERTIVVVEGELDALRAQAEGLSNFVGCSGSGLSIEALIRAKNYGARQVVLLFDYDGENAQEDTARKIARAADQVEAAGLKAFVAEFPPEGDKVDADEYLKNHSAEELRVIVEAALPRCIWECTRIWPKYPKEKSCIEFDNMRRDVADVYYRAPREDLPVLGSYIEDYTNGKISLDALKAERVNVDQRREKERHERIIKDGLEKAAELKSKGDIEGAERAIEEALKTANTATKTAKFAAHLEPPTAEELRNRRQAKAVGIPSGYYFRSKNDTHNLADWLIPAGALTFVGAQTSHGKSRLLQNLALTFADPDWRKDYTEHTREDLKKAKGAVLYLSLEEDSPDTEKRFLNLYFGKHLNQQGNNSEVISQYYSSGCTDTKFIKANLREDFIRKEGEFNALLTSGKLWIKGINDLPDIVYIESLCEYICTFLEQHTIKAVFVDYAQLLKVNRSTSSDKDRLTEVCDTLRALSVEKQIPIVLAAQLNREGDSPLDINVKQMADASNIEHCANTILLLWDSAQPPSKRENNSFWYKPKQNKKDTEDDFFTDEGRAIVNRGFTPHAPGTIYAVLAKNRNGERNIDAVWQVDSPVGVVVNQPGEADAMSKQQWKVKAAEPTAEELERREDDFNKLINKNQPKQLDVFNDTTK